MLDKLNNILSSHLLCIKYAPCAPDCGTPTQLQTHTHGDKMAEAVVATSDNCNACKPERAETETCIVHAICTNVCDGKGRGERGWGLSGLPPPPLCIVSARECYSSHKEVKFAAPGCRTLCVLAPYQFSSE